MKQKVVGTYDIGYEQCQLVIREGTGAEFYFLPEKGSVPRIKIGADQDKFDKVIKSLLHEAFEFSYCRMHGRFLPSEDMSNNHARYMFCFDHNQFSESCAVVAEFITAAIPDLKTAWEKWKKGPKKKVKK